MYVCAVHAMCQTAPMLHGTGCTPMLHSCLGHRQMVSLHANCRRPGQHYHWLRVWLAQKRGCHHVERRNEVVITLRSVFNFHHQSSQLQDYKYFTQQCSCIYIHVRKVVIININAVNLNWCEPSLDFHVKYNCRQQEVIWAIAWLPWHAVDAWVQVHADKSMFVLWDCRQSQFKNNVFVFWDPVSVDNHNSKTKKDNCFIINTSNW